MKPIFLGVLFIFLVSFQPVFALDSIEFLSGYLSARLEEKEDYQALPFLVSFNFDLKPFIEEKTGFNFKGEFNFSLEPFISYVYTPDSNVEVGVNFLGKYVFDFWEKVKLYLKGGLGVLYMSQHTREQSTQYNFLPQAGMGFSFFINETTSFNLEYRYRHLSNASFKNPNSGIDADLILGGIAIHF